MFIYNKKVSFLRAQSKIKRQYKLFEICYHLFKIKPVRLILFFLRVVDFTCNWGTLIKCDDKEKD